MNLSDIMDRFMLLADMEGEEASRWEWICRDAMEEISRRLRPGADEQGHSGLLSSAAAALSLYKLCLCTGPADDIDTFKAGDISISSKNKTERAKELWEAQKADIAFLLSDDSFLFRQVK